MKTLGRPIEFERGAVIGKATETFWRLGYEATSVSDLTQEMGLSKSSLYQSFGSKKELFETCLTSYIEAIASQMEKDLINSKTGFVFIENLLKSVAATAQRPEGANGCLLVNSINEVGQKDPDIAFLIDAKIEVLTKIFVKAVKRAQVEGDVPSHINPNFVASYLHVAVSGLRTIIKAGADSNSAEGAIRLILKAIT